MIKDGVGTVANEIQEDKFIKPSTSMNKDVVDKVVNQIQQDGVESVSSKHSVKNTKGDKPKASGASKVSTTKKKLVQAELEAGEEIAKIEKKKLLMKILTLKTIEIREELKKFHPNMKLNKKLK